MDQKEAIRKVSQYKNLLHQHLKFEQVFLFGSYAGKTYREDSDIDVAILVSDLHDDFFALNPLLWKLRREIDHRIEPVLLDINNDKTGFLDEVRKTGIEIV